MSLQSFIDMLFLIFTHSQVSSHLVAKESSRPANPRFDGSLARSQDGRDLVVSLSLHIPENQRRPIFIRQRSNRSLHCRPPLSIDHDGVLKWLTIARLEFTSLTAIVALKETC